MNPSKLRLLVLLALVLGLSAVGATAHAGNVGWSNVTWVQVQNGAGTNGQGIAFIYMGGTHQNPPSCASSQLWRWTVDLGTASGQEIYHTAKDALLHGRQFQIFGTGACGLWPDSESASYVFMQ